MVLEFLTLMQNFLIVKEKFSRGFSKIRILRRENCHNVFYSLFQQVLKTSPAIRMKEDGEEKAAPYSKEAHLKDQPN